MPSSGVQTCARSEEHTSELQSHDNLVCRLLLEKKKIILPGAHPRHPTPSRATAAQHAHHPPPSDRSPRRRPGRRGLTLLPLLRFSLFFFSFRPHPPCFSPPPPPPPSG